MPDVVKQRIVIVDDDADTLKLLKRQLNIAGYEVVDCPDGQTSLEPIAALGSGIVIADWDLPGMDGLELCATIRELEAMQAIQRIYFILLSAHRSKEHVVRGLDAGANDYLTKPYHAAELLARIKVGERMLRLQQELVHRQIEIQKASAQMALLARKLDEQASTDALTGLANRRCIFDRLEESWALADREQRPLSCIMLDVDHFKRVNDTYGHAAGDEVLRRVSKTIRGAGRRPDLCGRFGGEEFVVLCPATPAQGAVKLAERIRHSVESHEIVYEGKPICVTVSCGVASKTVQTQTPEDMIQNADAMLYRAKEHGRNQTRIFTEDLRTPTATEDEAPAAM